MTNRRTVRLLGIAGLLSVFASLAACVADQPTGQPRQRTASVTAPRIATYQCGRDGAMTIEISGGTAHIVGPGEIDVTLTASPPGQQIRFADPLNALVVEGREALFFANRKAPLTCQR